MKSYKSGFSLRTQMETELEDWHIGYCSEFFISF